MNLDSIYKFCTRCANPLIKKGDRFFLCLNCNLHIYLNPVPTNGLILENNQNQLLLVKRKFEPKKGFWDTPGGFIALKETVEESLKREIKEELNLDIKEFSFFGNYWSYYPYQDINYQTLYLVFTAKYHGEKISIADDVKDYRFFDKKTIPFDLIAFGDVLAAIKDYIKKYP